MDINWKKYIQSDPDILVGKPVVKGTRLSVDFLLSLLAKGWSEKQILKNYPRLTSDSLQAVFAFAAECMREEAFFKGWSIFVLTQLHQKKPLYPAEDFKTKERPSP